MFNVRKGAMPVGGLATMATILVAVAITIAMGALVLTNIQQTDTIVENSTAYNATQAGLDSMDTFADWLVIIAIVIVAVVVLALIKYL